MNARTDGRLDILADAPALARALADLFVDEAQTAIANRGAFYVALAGGTTPAASYRLLAQLPLDERISWTDVFVYFGDERCVKPDDPLSNYRTAYEAFLSSVPIPPANVHRMRGEIAPDAAAQEYAAVLRSDLGEKLALDLVMLGLGKDAHTASLFPGTDPLTDDDELARHTYSHETQTDRITITPKVINAARTVVFATEGAEKAPAVAAVREGAYDPTAHPAQIVAPTSGNLIWLIDKLAAGTLKQSTRS